MKPQFNLLKAFFVLAILFVSVNSIQGQEQRTDSERSITPKFGFKAGINLSNLYVDNVEDENMKLGINVGLLAKIPLIRGLSLQPELLYSSKGAKLIYNNILMGKGEYRFNLNYVEVPLLAVINLGKNFNLNAGGYVSYLASANIKDLNDDGTVTDIKDFNADNFNRIDYGLIGGLGVDVENFTIGARYNYGLREVGESGSGGASGYTQNSKNSVISIFIGLGF